MLAEIGGRRHCSARRPRANQIGADRETYSEAKRIDPALWHAVAYVSPSRAALGRDRTKVQGCPTLAEGLRVELIASGMDKKAPPIAAARPLAVWFARCAILRN